MTSVNPASTSVPLLMSPRYSDHSRRLMVHYYPSRSGPHHRRAAGHRFLGSHIRISQRISSLEDRRTESVHQPCCRSYLLRSIRCHSIVQTPRIESSTQVNSSEPFRQPEGPSLESPPEDRTLPPSSGVSGRRVRSPSPSAAQDPPTGLASSQTRRLWYPLHA